LRTKLLKTTALKKYLIYLLIIVPLFLTACATGIKSERLAPEWFKALEETEDENCYLIKISTFAADEVEAEEKAIDELYNRIMEISGKGDLFSKPEDQAELKDILRSIIETELPLEGIISLHRQELVLDDESSYYYGAFCIYKTVAEKLNDRLMETYYSNDEVLNAYLAAAKAYEDEMKYYKAAEELIKAALYIHQQSEPLSRDIAQLYIDKAGSLLAGISVSGVQAPESAFANMMIDVPFHILCSSEDAVIPEVEFLVRYEGKKRDGEKGQFERRLVSNDSGILEFYHPFIPFSGDAQIIFIPGSRNFQSSVQTLGDGGLDISTLSAWMKDSSIEYSLSVESASRMLSMGVVLLQTDITGTALNNNDSSVGLVEALSQDGFKVEVMTLDPAEVLLAGESAFFRDLRAYYKDVYERVIFGIVEIQDFESRGDSYRVKTGGTLKVVDVLSGEILMTLDLDKSVESRSNTLAVTASFRELGKAFAQKMISSLE
jgi:hypothetical protein